MAVQIEKLLELAVQTRASDLHLTVGVPPVLRVDGRLRPVKSSSGPLRPDDTTALMRAITSERLQQELAERGGVDFGFRYGDKGRFRVSVFRQKGMTGLVLRLIPQKLFDLDELGLPP